MTPTCLKRATSSFLFVLHPCSITERGPYNTVRYVTPWMVVGLFLAQMDSVFWRRGPHATLS